MADKVARQIWVLTKLSVDKRQSSCRNYSHIGAQCIGTDKVEVRTLEVFHHVEHVAICCTLGLGVSFTPLLRAGAIDANKQFPVWGRSNQRNAGGYPAPVDERRHRQNHRG